MKIDRVIFDLDNTLLDTEQFKNNLFNFLKSNYALGDDEVADIYKEARDISGEVAFGQETFKKVLSKKLYLVNKEYDNRLIDNFFGNTNWQDYLLPGSIELIKFCINLKIDIYLLSLGYPEWQMYKIVKSGLDKYFNVKHGKIIFTSRPDDGKIDALIRLLGYNNKKGNNTVLINDKPDETVKILNYFPGMFAMIHKARKDFRYNGDNFNSIGKQFAGRVIISDELNKFEKELEKLINQ